MELGSFWGLVLKEKDFFLITPRATDPPAAGRGGTEVHREKGMNISEG